MYPWIFQLAGERLISIYVFQTLHGPAFAFMGAVESAAVSVRDAAPHQPSAGLCLSGCGHISHVADQDVVETADGLGRSD